MVSNQLLPVFITAFEQPFSFFVARAFFFLLHHLDWFPLISNLSHYLYSANTVVKTHLRSLFLQFCEQDSFLSSVLTFNVEIW